MSPARASRKARSRRPARNPGPPATRSASSVAFDGRTGGDQLRERDVTHLASLVPATGHVQDHDPRGPELGVHATEPKLHARDARHGRRAVAGSAVPGPAHEVRSRAFADPEVRRRDRDPEPGRRRRTTRTERAHSGGLARLERFAGRSFEDQPPRCRAAHPECLEPREAANTGVVETHDEPSDLVIDAKAGGDEDMGQVRQPRRPGLLPGEPPRSAVVEGGRCPGHGTAGRRAAALLGRGVVQQRPVFDDLAVQLTPVVSSGPLDRASPR